MNNQYRLLDCTLRDGGHITGGNYGESTITGTIEKLVEAKVDIIEVGFMWDQPLSTDYTRFYSMEDVKRILPKDCGNSTIGVMIEKQNLMDHIEDCDGTIKYVRVIFKRHLLDWACDTARELLAKGYQVSMNPVNCTVYTDEEYINVIKRVNEVHPTVFSMVDTFGNMRLEDFEKRFILVNEHLDKDIQMGIHLHENLGLAFAMAQRAIEKRYPDRKYIIDGSLIGMGRDPGNLKMEQIAEYMNYKFDQGYNMSAIYDAISQYIQPIHEKYGWGFKLPYAMSAYYDLHRTYPEFLMNKGDLSMRDIDVILSRVDHSEAEYYNEEYIEKLYQEYKKEK